MTAYIDKKYINLVSGILEKFSWKKNNLANCRCPICGDSQRNKSKARGYFYEKNNEYLYKCHNCGCGCNINNFLKQVSPSLSKEYYVERFKDGTDRKRKEPTMLSFKKPKFKPKSSYLTPLTPVDKLKSNHPCVEFLNFRMIPKQYWKYLYFTEDFGSYMKHLDPDCSSVGKEERLVIPIFNKNDDVVGAQGRALTMNEEYNARNTAKYITIKADKSIDRLWYGIWRANPKKTVYVVEGPLDSLFIPNTIAMIGAGAADYIPERFSDSNLVFALDNEPRNLQIIKFNEKLIDRGHTICIWPTSLNYKDINDMVSTISTKEIKKIIDTNSFSGLKAKAQLQQWRKV